MTSDFRIYWELLRISPSECPPHHYRLLDLPLFADDPAAIEAAYQRQVARVQPYIAGPDVVQCVELLNKLLQARDLLLNQAAKSAYDAGLAHAISAPPYPRAPAAGQLSSVPIATRPPARAATAAPQRRDKASPKKKSPPQRAKFPTLARLGVMAVLFVVTMLLTIVALRPDVVGLGRPPTNVVTADPTEVKTPQLSRPATEVSQTPVAAQATAPSATPPVAVPAKSASTTPSKLAAGEAPGAMPTTSAEPASTEPASRRKKNDAIGSIKLQPNSFTSLFHFFNDSRFVTQGSWGESDDGRQPVGDDGASIHFKQPYKDLELLALCRDAQGDVGLAVNGVGFWRNDNDYTIGYLRDPQHAPGSLKDFTPAHKTFPIATLKADFVFGVAQRGESRYVLLFPHAAGSDVRQIMLRMPNTGRVVHFIVRGNVSIREANVRVHDTIRNEDWSVEEIVSCKQKMFWQILGKTVVEFPKTLPPTSPVAAASAPKAAMPARKRSQQRVVPGLTTWEPANGKDFNPSNEKYDIVDYLMQFRDMRPLVQKAQAIDPQDRMPVPVKGTIGAGYDSARKIFLNYLESQTSTKTHDTHDQFYHQAISLALDTKDDHVGVYGLISVAAQEAAYRRNLPHILLAAYVRASRFDIDPHDEELRVLIKDFPTLNTYSKSPTEDLLYSFRYCLANARQRIATEPELALRYLELILYNFHNQPKLARYPDEARALIQQIEAKLRSPMQLAAAEARLMQKPDSTEANYAFGYIHCFFREDWASGLPALLKSSDDQLQQPTKMELGGDAAEKKLAIGDAWWNQREHISEDYRGAIMRHAADWYQQALPNLSSTDRLWVESRINEAAQMKRK